MEPISEKETELIKLDTAANRLVQSQCMQKVLECLPEQVLLELMMTSKRFNHGFIPPIFDPISVFEPKLLRIFCNSSCVEIFSHACLAWERIYVCAANHTLRSAMKYFEGEDQTYPTESNITQLSN